MSNRLVQIDINQPTPIVEVDDVLDNGNWKFCTDDPMSDDASYEMFVLGPDAVVPADTVVRINHLWGFGQNGITEPIDYQVTVDKDTTVQRVVHVLLSRYHADLLADDAAGRFLYIEQVSPSADNGIEIVWGS